MTTAELALARGRRAEDDLAVAGLRKRGEHILDALVSPLEDAARDQEAAEAAKAPATAVELLLFLLLLISLALFEILTVVEGHKGFDFRPSEVKPALVEEPTPVASTTTTAVAATTTTQIEVVQPPTEVVEGPAPAPPPGPAPAPDTAAPPPDTAAPPPSHGG